MARKLTIKQNRWVEETVKTLNPTEAVRRVYNTKNDDVAKSIAYENLTKPYLKNAVENELKRLGLNEKEIAKIHKRNIEQSENISASNTALDIYFKLTGAYAPEKKTNLNINSDFEDPNNRVKELLIELRRIGELNNNLLDELKNIP
ncbi:hypothetical protein A3I34_02825 [Candidatus Jorgensenbacteria bacterium RIFCSPLOWO2_02_FULL_45_12]|uniref:Terminase small subunit n=1 Tax=Candidatus Jorgensenbacteria bacterium RIFCSPHIGHO2_02_FULL_45_20 TaxID=1798470 RepID=A0A1F6BQK1_9BACT|nr:MAG: hypothetical protein A3D55_00215 [Candidatus Jorgensenbacteria bacterium RIFCSPHIGHO2_02_FULL_45_20]OGG42285.1 MAG: hypothetical protein A3I34_02825 [Candidatus Jorgensenbacteria bacterium RIFCSPLOWO2_02_FULL_45_12]